jgi:hypothetical protein
MSAFPPKADIAERRRHFSKAGIAHFTSWASRNHKKQQ